MKKLIAVLSLFIVTSFSVPKTDTVYICNSSTAYVYHSTESCRGLNKCSHGVKRVTKTEAINNYGRRACKICY